MKETIELNKEVMARWFENSYHGPYCDIKWIDEWSCMCNDKCPEWNAEIEPYDSADLSRPITDDDYLNAARLIANMTNASKRDATDDEARQYAEAILEGGEHRFMLTQKTF